jgi:menaquinone-dependent protoporphyrinogen oxidase
MRALVVYGSKLGGTAGLADMIGHGLQRHGMVADIRPAASVQSLDGYDAVVVGGALYAGRWHRDARRFVKRHGRDLRGVPVWLFSSGPLGDGGQKPDIPPVRGVAKLMHAIHARGHETFGGRLSPDAPGVMARAMAKTLAGDWRDPDQADRWSARIVTELTAETTPSDRVPGSGMTEGAAS